MVVVGLTGGIGSGKTTVLELFKELGVACYIADKEAKRLMNSSSVIKDEIIQVFGRNAYDKNGLNRKYIADIVFNNKKKLEELNTIVHPKVHEDFKNFIKNSHSNYVIYESAILHESKGARLCDFIITITAPLKLRIQRVMSRDNITEEAVLNRMKNQLSDEEKIENSDFVITNINLKHTLSEVKRLHKKLLQKTKIHNK